MVFRSLFLYNRGQNQTHLPCYYLVANIDELDSRPLLIFSTKRQRKAPALKPSISISTTNMFALLERLLRVMMSRRSF